MIPVSTTTAVVSAFGFGKNTSIQLLQCLSELLNGDIILDRTFPHLI